METKSISDAEREEFSAKDSGLTWGQVTTQIANAIERTIKANAEVARHAAKLAKGWDGEKALNDFADIIEGVKK